MHNMQSGKKQMPNHGGNSLLTVEESFKDWRWLGEVPAAAAVAGGVTLRKKEERSTFWARRFVLIVCLEQMQKG